MLIWNFIGFFLSRPQYNLRPWIFMLLQWCSCDVQELSMDLIAQTLRLIAELCVIKLLSSWSHIDILKLLPPHSTRLADFVCWSLPSLNCSSFTNASYLAGGGGRHCLGLSPQCSQEQAAAMAAVLQLLLSFMPIREIRTTTCLSQHLMVL